VIICQEGINIPYLWYCPYLLMISLLYQVSDVASCLGSNVNYVRTGSRASYLHVGYLYVILFLLGQYIQETQIQISFSFFSNHHVRRLSEFNGRLVILFRRYDVVKKLIIILKLSTPRWQSLRFIPKKCSMLNTYIYHQLPATCFGICYTIFRVYFTFCSNITKSIFF
jgi:hypothetical protein